MQTNFNLRKRSSCHTSSFNKSIFDIKLISSFNFEKGLISKDIPEYSFNNFANSTSDEEYNLVINYYIGYLNGDYSFLDNDFDMDEDILQFSDRVKRLFNIIYKVQNTKYYEKDCQYILKMNNNINKNLHFYIRKNNFNISILLIDLYHMGIYGERYINGKKKPIRMERLYKHHKDNKYNLSEIKKLKENC